MKERIRIRVKTGLKDLYAFMMYHNYTHFNGIFGLICGILCLIAGIGFADKLEHVFILADIIGVFYTFGTPLVLYSRARKQAQRSIVFANDIIYFMDVNGFSVKVGAESARAEWSEVTSVRVVGNRIFIYMGIKNAHILPVDQLGSQLDDVVSLIKASVDRKKIKGKLFKDDKNNE